MQKAKQLFYFQTPQERRLREERAKNNWTEVDLIIKTGISHHILFTAFAKTLKEFESHERPVVHDDTHGGRYFILSFPAKLERVRITMFVASMVHFLREHGRNDPI